MYIIKYSLGSGDFYIKPEEVDDKLSDVIDIIHTVSSSRFDIMIGYYKGNIPVMLHGESGSPVNIFSVSWLSCSPEEAYNIGVKDNVFSANHKSIVPFFEWRHKIREQQQEAFYEVDMWVPRDVKEHCIDVLGDYFTNKIGDTFIQGLI